jgi:tRNA/rRNA methyltransferase
MPAAIPQSQLRPASPADPTRFILLGTSHPGNVGATARAMKVMGFSDLVLVAPRYPNVQRKQEAISLASGALDILENARVVDTLTEALDGITHACATAMTPRDFGPPTHAPRELFSSLAASPQRVALIFGCERFGMSNEDVNLAQAVQLLAYDWRQALGGFDVTARTVDAKLADGVAVQGALDHWQDALQRVGFLDPQAPRKLMPRLNQLLNRSALTTEEVHILRGMARAVIDLADRP